MRKILGLILPALFVISGFASAQTAPRGTADRNPQMNLDFLIDMLRSAGAAHAKVKDMELQKSIGPESGPARAGTLNQRTAVMVGTGAGIGVAVGGMSGNQKGILIGAIAGGAGGLIIDQIMKHRAAKQDLVTSPAYIEPEPEHLELKQRPATPATRP